MNAVKQYGDQWCVFVGLDAIGLMALKDIPAWLSQAALVASVIANAAHKSFYSKSSE